MTENQKTFASAAIGMATGGVLVAIPGMGWAILIALGATAYLELCGITKGDGYVKNVAVHLAVSAACFLYGLSLYDTENAQSLLIGDDDVIVGVVAEAPVHKPTIPFQLS